MGQLYRRLSLDGGRTIVISDVHGNLACLRGLLDKLALAPSDRLILLGDLVERGPESLATLRYALSLRSRCRLWGVLGNWDLWHLWADGTDPKWDEWVRGYLLRRKNTPCRGLVLEMCREAGIELAPDFSMPALKAALRERFAPEFDYLRSLPCLLESEDFVFVHGGLARGHAPGKGRPLAMREAGWVLRLPAPLSQMGGGGPYPRVPVRLGYHLRRAHRGQGVPGGLHRRRLRP